MPAGRPTKKPKDICAEVDKYLKKVEKEDELASIAGFCKFLDITKQTVYNWGAQDAKFLDYLKKIEREQEFSLIKNGLSKKFDSSITKLMLARLGYSDKIENKLTGDEHNPVHIKQIERVIVDPSDWNPTLGS